MRDRRSPVIIIGMHRSGTTMIANMLQQLGLFIGSDLEDNSESMFFINHNDWLLEQGGCAWDNPSNIFWSMCQNDILGLSVEYIRDRLRGLPTIKYVGVKRAVCNENLLLGLSQPWGWKDPRTTFTLPVWHQIFPDLRIIHIYRNGVPVAASLRSRERNHLQKAKRIHSKRKNMGVYRVMKKSGGFVWSNRCLSLDGGFSLWEEYVLKATEMVEEFSSHSISVKYEEFLVEPSLYLRKLSEFCGLDASDSQIQSVSSAVRPSHANAFENDDELVDFYSTVRSRDMMVRLGYG